MTSRTDRTRTDCGFTLLELIIAVTTLAAFLLPMLHLIAESRTRAIRYTQQRQVRELARQKLHDRIHYYVEDDSGTFEEEGKPTWTWEIEPPEMRGQGQQVLLQYRITVFVPLRLEGSSSEAGDGSTYEYTVWTFPTERWYEEQQILYESGEYSPLYSNYSTGYGDAAYGAMGGY